MEGTDLLQSADLDIGKEAKEFHILVVEDNHSDYRLIERYLRRSDMSCVLAWAPTAEKALTLLKTESFDVVLLDFVLPDANGLDLFAEMDVLGFDLPVTFVTGMGNERAAVEAFKLGAQDYLIKDVSGEYLNLLPYVIQKGYQQWEDGRERRRTEIALRELNATLEKKIDERTEEIREREALTIAILNREKEQRLWAETLQKITRFLNRSLNLENVLQGILEQLSRVVDYQSANVMLVSGEKLDVVAYHHKEGKPQTMRTVESRALAYVNRVVVGQHPIYVPDTDKDPQWKTIPGADKIRCWVGVPLVVQSKSIGLLNLNQIEPNAFSDKLIRMTAAFANQAAAAIENARLYRQATKEIEDRRRAEAALEAERAMLAQRVSERTAELTKANHKLAQALQAKDQFLANMSHELRTPLTAILGKTEVLQEGVYDPLTEKQLQAIKIIDSSSSHLLSLINDILDVTRIETGQLEISWEMVALQSLCESSIQFIAEEGRKKNITIHKQFDEVQTIRADNRRLKQILVNLLSNAVKFTPDDGDIGLEVHGDWLNELVKIVVWDTGIGISEEGKQKLFGEMNRPQPFVQLDSALSRQYQGSGLGLALVYALTEMHNGSMRIESEAGLGTRITISLPWSRGKRPSVETAELSADENNNLLENAYQQQLRGRVLLAEDNYYTIEGLVDYLTFIGFEVFVAVDGDRAVRQAAEIEPDLIIMDIQLPKRDGLEAIKMIRSELGMIDVPIIALTALTMPGDRERCLHAGANEFISKPFNLRQVTEVIQQFDGIGN